MDLSPDGGSSISFDTNRLRQFFRDDAPGNDVAILALRDSGAEKQNAATPFDRESRRFVFLAGGRGVEWEAVRPAVLQGMPSCYAA